MSDITKEMLDYLNEVKVNFEDLEIIFDQVDRLDVEGRTTPDIALFLIAQNNKGNVPKAHAVLSRIDALLEVLKNQKAPGWTMPLTKEGWIPTRDELIKAAAVCPLCQVNDKVGFDIETLVQTALELAEPEGSRATVETD